MLLPLVVFAGLLSTTLSFLENPEKGNKLQFTSSANGIIDPNDPLTLTCTFKPSDHPDFAKLLSIKLLKRSLGSMKYVDLLTVTESQVQDTDHFTGASSGYISTDSSASDLTAMFDHPTQDDRGFYKCQARGLDSSSMSVGSESSLLIGQLDYADLLNCTQSEPRTTLAYLKESLIQCGASSENWFEMFRDMRQFEASSSPDVFEMTPIFQSTSFYIFTTDKVDFNSALQLCKRNSGYLAEINTEQEFLFLANYWRKVFAKKPRSLTYFLLGASYQSFDDDFEFYTHPGTSMYLGHWALNEPHRDYIKYNWLLVKADSINLEMADGTKEHDQLGNICEISKDTV